MDALSARGSASTIFRSWLTIYYPILMRIPESKWPDSGYKIYALLENGSRLRYIGITSQNSKKRLSQHMAQKGVSYKTNWVRKCVTDGTEVTIHVFSRTYSLAKALRVESAIISILRRRCNLVNGSFGGEHGLKLGKHKHPYIRMPNKKDCGTAMPPPGTLLYTLLIDDPHSGVCEKIEIHQGIRSNGIEPRLFGQPFVKSRYCGFDLLFRELRKRWSLRWLVVN